MTEPRRICVVTGGRADYGLLKWVMHDIRAAADLELQLVVTGSHLEPAFGMSVGQIEADGFTIDARVPIGLEADGPGDVVRSMARCLTGVSDALGALKPDILLVLGDRYEILAAAQAALIHGVPIAHIAGGDTTEGAFDESIRHALTQIAHLHLVTHETSARRVRQMGAPPERVHVVGSPGLDQIRRVPLLDRTGLESALGATLGERNILVTFHPVTLAADGGQEAWQAVLQALDALPRAVVKWITRPNADPGHRALEDALDAWARDRSDVRVFASLGPLRYLSLMAQVDAVVGNSSSGLYEAPSFGVPTVDIGDRQKGRLAAASVVRCTADAASIRQAVEAAFAMDCAGVVNPYGDGFSAGRIVQILKAAPSRAELLSRSLHEVGA